jgi:hypothetical protein
MNSTPYSRGSMKTQSRTLVDFQKTLEYCLEENNVLREILRDKCKRIHLTDTKKKRLTTRNINLDKRLLKDIVKIFQPETVLGWHKDLIEKKYDSTNPNGAKRGPKQTPPEVVSLNGSVSYHHIKMFSPSQIFSQLKS